MIVTGKEFKRFLSVVLKYTAGGSSIPGLRCVVFKTENDRITLTATNLSCFCRIRTKWDALKYECAVPAPALRTVLKTIRDKDRVEVQMLNEGMMRIRTSRATHVLMKTVDVADCPIANTAWEFESPSFTCIVPTTMIADACSRDVERPMLTLLHVLTKTKAIYAADGFRIYRLELETQGDTASFAFRRGLLFEDGVQLSVQEGSPRFVMAKSGPVEVYCEADDNAFHGAEGLYEKELNRHKTMCLFDPDKVIWLLEPYTKLVKHVLVAPNGMHLWPGADGAHLIRVVGGLTSDVVLGLDVRYLVATLKYAGGQCSFGLTSDKPSGPVFIRAQGRDAIIMPMQVGDTPPLGLESNFLDVLPEAQDE